MRKLFILAVVAALFASQVASAQDDKSKRPSPPAVATATLTNGATITIQYSQPSVKGRTLGKEIAPFGKVWRTGANEATTFETSKDLSIDGKTLPAGKYSLYTIPGENEWTIIFNKSWDQWGTRYKEADDLIRFTVEPSKAAFSEQMKFDIDKKGKIKLNWADTMVAFKVA